MALTDKEKQLIDFSIKAATINFRGSTNDKFLMRLKETLIAAHVFTEEEANVVVSSIDVGFGNESINDHILFMVADNIAQYISNLRNYAVNRFGMIYFWNKIKKIYIGTELI